MNPFKINPRQIVSKCKLQYRAHSPLNSFLFKYNSSILTKLANMDFGIRPVVQEIIEQSQKPVSQLQGLRISWLALQGVAVAPTHSPTSTFEDRFSTTSWLSLPILSDTRPKFSEHQTTFITHQRPNKSYHPAHTKHHLSPSTHKIIIITQHMPNTKRIERITQAVSSGQLSRMWQDCI